LSINLNLIFKIDGTKKRQINQKIKIPIKTQTEKGKDTPGILKHRKGYQRKHGEKVRS